jgi:hypothetical protein
MADFVGTIENMKTSSANSVNFTIINRWRFIKRTGVVAAILKLFRANEGDSGDTVTIDFPLMCPH